MVCCSRKAKDLLVMFSFPRGGFLTLAAVFLSVKAVCGHASAKINCERVSAHCSNAAVSVIQVFRADIGSHDYLSGLKSGRSVGFMKSYNTYGQKYRLASE